MGDVAARAIRGAIARDGPIRFDHFMELALYGEGGFYQGTPVGAGEDFVTSPHVHGVFGELLGTAIREMHDALGRPAPFRLMEVGAGDGTLARQLLGATADRAPVYTAVETSTAARSELRATEGLTVASELPEEPAHVLLANELLDNLPFRMTRDGREVLVGAEGGGFVEVAGGPVHGYRDHAIVADVLAHPGDNDITAGVDMTAIAARAEAGGLVAFPTVTQREALRSLGFEPWYRERLEQQHRQLSDRDGVGAVRTWSDKSRATLLMDPGALGRLRWLLLATRGLPPPPWLREALGGSLP